MAHDGHVRVLPERVANQIAAGEVIERPASVVKELVENAIDASATRIGIAVSAGGRKSIEVEDDGFGMTREDALTALERQATSKISEVEDIENIETLGFRGEAIPSIASVSRFSLVTRRAEADDGVRIDVDGGRLAATEPIGCPPGTRVTVRELFFNVPVRRKFLKSIATEESHIKAVFTTAALAHPALGFSLTLDGREVYRLAKGATFIERVRELFGESELENFLALESGDAERIKVRGLIERPGLAQPSRRENYVFVNGRPASAPVINFAIRDAYPRKQGDVRPAAIIFIDLPSGDVDVNVHPAKREVRFRDTSAVRRALSEAIERSLASSATKCVRMAEPPEPTAAPSVDRNVKSPIESPAIAANAPAAAKVSDLKPCTPPLAPAPVEVELPIAVAEDRAQTWAWFEFLATTASGYLIIETDSGLVTINPNAALERIAFERLSDAAAGEVASQPLLIPETIRLPPPEFARLANALDVLGRLGFQLEPFGTDTLKVEAIPQLVGDLPLASLLSTIAGDLAESGVRRGGARWKDELIARSIARTYSGKKIDLDRDSAIKLVEDLARTRMPYVTPRGKSVMIFTSTSELDRKFSR